MIELPKRELPAAPVSWPRRSCRNGLSSAPSVALVTDRVTAKRANRVGEQFKLAKDRLLAGEDPATSHPNDADYWLGIYRALVGFKSNFWAKL